MQPVLLTVGECAARLGVSRGVVYAALTAGTLPGYRFGRPGRRGSWRVAPHDLEHWVLSLKVSMPPSAAVPDRRPTRLRHISLD